MTNQQLASIDLDDLALSLFRLGLHLVRQERGIAGGKGTLRIPKLSALAAVADAESVQVHMLASAEGVREPTMSSTVGVLVEAKLVRLEQDPNDDRSVRVLPTETGTKQLVREKRRLASLLREVDLDAARIHKARDAVETLIGIVADYQRKQQTRKEALRSRRHSRPVEG